MGISPVGCRISVSLMPSGRVMSTVGILTPPGSSTMPPGCGSAPSGTGLPSGSCEPDLLGVRHLCWSPLRTATSARWCVLCSNSSLQQPPLDKVLHTRSYQCPVQSVPRLSFILFTSRCSSSWISSDYVPVTSPLPVQVATRAHQGCIGLIRLAIAAHLYTCCSVGRSSSHMCKAVTSGYNGLLIPV